MDFKAWNDRELLGVIFLKSDSQNSDSNNRELAYYEFHLRYYRPVLRMVARQVLVHKKPGIPLWEQPMVQAVVQEIFIRVPMASEKFKPSGGFSAADIRRDCKCWLGEILRGVILDLLRHDRRSTSPHHYSGKSIWTDVITEAYCKLHADEQIAIRACVEKYDVTNGMTTLKAVLIARIAETLNVSRGQAKDTCKKAIEKIRGEIVRIFGEVDNEAIAFGGVFDE